MESSALTETSRPPAPIDHDGASGRVLPSGRSLVVRSDDRHEEIEVRSPDGAMEIRIAFTDRGPVLSLRGVRLEIDAASSIGVKCRDLVVSAAEKIHLSAGNLGLRSSGEIRVKSDAQTFIDGDYVNLNCLSREGYHDYVAAEEVVSSRGAPAELDSAPGDGDSGVSPDQDSG